jgi:small GTP-binding protein
VVRIASKVVVLGDGAVGKTSLVHRFVKNKFKQTYSATIGVDILSKNVELKRDNINYSIDLNLWDMAGQEHFKLIRTKFYKQASSGLLVFDVTSESSFKNLENWVNESRNGIGTDIPYVLIGNKIDLAEQRKISFDQMKEFGQELGIQLDLIIETSALSGEGVENAFDYLANSIVDYHLKNK